MHTPTNPTLSLSSPELNTSSTGPAAPGCPADESRLMSRMEIVDLSECSARDIAFLIHGSADHDVVEELERHWHHTRLTRTSRPTNRREQKRCSKRKRRFQARRIA